MWFSVWSLKTVPPPFIALTTFQPFGLRPIILRLFFRAPLFLHHRPSASPTLSRCSDFKGSNSLRKTPLGPGPGLAATSRGALPAVSSLQISHHSSTAFSKPKVDRPPLQALPASFPNTEPNPTYRYQSVPRSSAHRPLTALNMSQMHRERLSPSTIGSAFDLNSDKKAYSAVMWTLHQIGSRRCHHIHMLNERAASVWPPPISSIAGESIASFVTLCSKSNPTTPCFFDKGNRGSIIKLNITFIRTLLSSGSGHIHSMEGCDNSSIPYQPVRQTGNERAHRQIAPDEGLDEGYMQCAQHSGFHTPQTQTRILSLPRRRGGCSPVTALGLSIHVTVVGFKGA
ncbi:uncharacterized protein CLUP02_05447 [Colletotrichum lupini]|uniref:Uncharacterized protein n=1 Tax=Colletotrichum lupini TaxID=145971 RepID=A0A9Q8SM81_9PEZI|nr:uncharacterized protein CLUP02_05447 [Colletotrichum lupini]UQC79966.1 hypothetical protein CLUP02_05447 [Colletotrichum lupini]